VERSKGFALLSCSACEGGPKSECRKRNAVPDLQVGCPGKMATTRLVGKKRRRRGFEGKGHEGGKRIIVGIPTYAESARHKGGPSGTMQARKRESGASLFAIEGVSKGKDGRKSICPHLTPGKKKVGERGKTENQAGKRGEGKSVNCRVKIR